jgi:hypothetical protein
MDALKLYIEDHLRKGYIQRSKSPVASPFFFVNKKDGKLRPVQDYRALNDITVKNATPLPLIPDLIDKLQGSRYFTKFDVRWGYKQPSAFAKATNGKPLSNAPSDSSNPLS